MLEPMRDVVEPFLRSADDAAGGPYTAVLYGSLARGEFLPGRSDINLLVVFPEIWPRLLDGLRPGLQAWHGHGFPPPLLFAQDEWARAHDVYQLELADILVAYRVLRGEDPVAGTRLQPAILRRALERELRGKVLRLRQAYGTAGGEPETLGATATASAGPMLVMLRGVLAMHGLPVPTATAGLLEALGTRLGLDVAPVGVVAAHRPDRSWACPAADFMAYLAAVTAVADHVDRYDTGGPR
jgi:predicted nucleotidyltransferase